MRVEIIFSPEWNDNPTSYGNPSKHYPSLPIQGIPIFSGTLTAQRGVDLIKKRSLGTRWTVGPPSVFHPCWMWGKWTPFAYVRFWRILGTFLRKKRFLCFSDVFCSFWCQEIKWRGLSESKIPFQVGRFMGYHIFLIFTDPLYIHGLKGTFFHRIILKYLILIFWLMLYFTVNQGKKSIFIRNWKTKFQMTSYNIHLVSYALSS